MRIAIKMILNWRKCVDSDSDIIKQIEANSWRVHTVDGMAIVYDVEKDSPMRMSFTDFCKLVDGRLSIN